VHCDTTLDSTDPQGLTKDKPKDLPIFFIYEYFYFPRKKTTNFNAPLAKINNKKTSIFLVVAGF